jgi:hypothetical protein
MFRWLFCILLQVYAFIMCAGMICFLCYMVWATYEDIKTWLNKQARMRRYYE